MKYQAINSYFGRMRTVILAAGIASLGVVAMNVPAVHAAQTVPTVINFQGRLADSTGVPLADGLYNIRFRAYFNAPTGGSPTWTETHDAGNRVTVRNGIFSTKLGSITPFSSSDFTGYTIYIETELPTPGTATCDGVGCSPSWTEGAMTPRQPIASNAYAMNADLIDGIDGASLAQLSANQTFTGGATFTGTFLQQNTSTTAFRIQNAGGTNALLVDTSGLAVKIGGGDVTPDASPALLVLDYKNTTGDPTGVDGAMYYNSAAGTFRCREDGLWKNCVSSARTRLDMHYEFMRNSTPALADANYVLDGGLYTKLTNGNFARIAGELNHPGIVQFRTGTSATGLASLSSSSDTTHGILFGGGAWINTTVLRVPTASGSGQTFNVYTGFLDATTTLTPANGCFFRYTDTLNSGRWQGVCRNANNETGSTCDPVRSGPTSAPAVGGTTWYTLKVAVNAAATQAVFVLEDGSNLYTCSVSSNITANAVSIGMGVLKTAGITQRSIDFDLTETIGEGLSR